MLDQLTALTVDRDMVKHQLAISDAKLQQLQDSVIKEQEALAEVKEKSDAQLALAKEESEKLRNESAKLRATLETTKALKVPTTHHVASDLHST